MVTTANYLLRANVSNSDFYFEYADCGDVWTALEQFWHDDYPETIANLPDCGTFPIDVTPAFFRAVNPYLPFTFVIDAMRECVCDTWGADYWIDLLKLCAYVLVALVLGLLVRRVFRKPVRFFTKKIDETGLL